MERIDRLEAVVETLTTYVKDIGSTGKRTEANLARLADVVNTIAASAASHDTQIEGLLRLAEKQAADTQALKEQVANLTREWQAYLRTIHPRQ